MKRYYYELMDEDYNSYEAAIPDGRIKARAIAQAKRAMRDLGIRRALLVVNFRVKDFFNWTFFLTFTLHYTTLNN